MFRQGNALDDKSPPVEDKTEAVGIERGTSNSRVLLCVRPAKKISLLPPERLRAALDDEMMKCQMRRRTHLQSIPETALWMRNEMMGCLS
ncbi:uncharacterized protein LOC144992231 isoform X2 [Oryzias latipes]